MQGIRPRLAVAAIAISLVGDVPFPKTSRETCALLSPQVASKVLKGTAAPDPVQPGNLICVWTVSSLRFLSPRLSYGVGQGSLAGGSGSVAVRGIGDAALWSQQTHTLLAAHHSVTVDVHLETWDGTPSDGVADLAAVARDILRHF
jgi:hypothetical protein